MVSIRGRARAGLVGCKKFSTPAPAKPSSTDYSCHAPASPASTFHSPSIASGTDHSCHAPDFPCFLSL